MPWICLMSLTTGGNCSRNWNEKPILQEMPFPKTGSDKFVQNFPMLLFSLLQVDYSIILRKIRSFPFCVRWDKFGNMEVVFDTVNKKGMAMMQKKYMKQVGHADAQMFFYVDSAKELAAKIGGNAKVIAEEPYYRHIPQKWSETCLQGSAWRFQIGSVW